MRTFGFLTNGHSMRAFMTGFNKDWAVREADGTHSMPPQIDTAIEAVAQSLVNLSTGTEQVYYSTEGVNGTGDQNDIFAEGRGLFYSQMLGQATYLKGVTNDDYGVMPFPKYDENQKNYRGGYCDDMTAVMIPYNCKDEYMVGAVTEMLAMIGWSEVTDAYYEETLKYQSFNAPECVPILELVRVNLSPTFTSVYGMNLSGTSSLVANVIESNIKNSANGTIANAYSTSIGTWRRQLRDLYEDLDKIAADRAAS